MYDLPMTSPVISPVQRAPRWAGLMRQHADDAESNRYLSKEVALVLRKTGCIKLVRRGLNPVKSQTQSPRLKSYRRFPVLRDLQDEI